MDRIEETIGEYIQSELLTDQGHRLGPDDLLLLDGFIDSIGATRLVGFVEQRWGLEIPPQDVTVENFGTIRHIAGYVRGRVNGGEL